MNITFPLILDGAMGTQLQKKGMPAGVCPEKWVLENPDKAIAIQSAYVDAGSQIIYSPTFGANSCRLESHGIFNKVEEYNIELVKIAKASAKDKALVAGDISSTGEMLYPLGNMSFEDFYDVYHEQASALEKAGVDLFVVETMSNIVEARAAVLAIKDVSSKPIFASFSCNQFGKTMMGTDICAALMIMQGMGVDAFGLNCSVGPEEMLTQIKRLNKISSVPLIAKANAGLPMRQGVLTVYSVDAKSYAKYIPELANAGVKIFGSCCGSDENYIKEIKKALDSSSFNEIKPECLDLLPASSEKEMFLLDPSVSVSQVFACDDELEDNIAELEEGELFGIEIRSLADVSAFADIQYMIKNPLCIVCDDGDLLERTLRHYQGRALYDGNLPDSVLLPLAKKYGLII